MQENITPKPHPKASAIHAIMGVESTLVERVAILEIIIRVVDDLCEEPRCSFDSRALVGLSFLLRQTSDALSEASDTLEFAGREVRA